MKKKKTKNKRKTRRLIIVTLLFIETKGKKDKTKQNKRNNQKNNPKSTYTFGEKKNLFVCQEENSARLLVMSTLIDPNQKKKFKLAVTFEIGEES